MEIINMQAITTAIALSIVVQYFIDKLKYTLPNINNDKLYSVLVAAIAFVASVMLVLAFDVTLFTSKFNSINYVLTALIIASGSSAINELVGALNNIKNKEN